MSDLRAEPVAANSIGAGFRVDLDFWMDSADLTCLACGAKISFGHDDDETLAELSQRAEKHAEECTP